MACLAGGMKGFALQMPCLAGQTFVPAVIDRADNLTVAPWGDLVLCEDGPDEQFLSGITPKGGFYKIARNAVSNSEFAGATFSPDSTTLFVNIQRQGLTLAITGPWRR